MSRNAASPDSMNIRTNSRCKLLVAVHCAQELFPVNGSSGIDPLFRRAVDAFRDFGCAAGRDEIPTDGLAQPHAIERLGQVVIHSGVPALLFGTLHRVGRQRDDRNALRAALARADFPCRLVPVHHRHLAVHQDRLISSGLPRGNGIGAVAHDVNFVAHPFQRAARHFLVHQIVLGHQDAQLARTYPEFARPTTMGWVRWCHFAASTAMTRVRHSRNSR